MKTPLFIATADVHLRADAPAARRPAQYLTAMWTKFNQILDLGRHHGVPIICAGDLGQHPYWPNWLLAETIRTFKPHAVTFCLTPGQHDLPSHRLSEWPRAAVGVLAAAGGNFLLFHSSEETWKIGGCQFRFFPYGEDISNTTFNASRCEAPTVAVAHRMVIKNRPLWPGQMAPRGHELLRKYPEFDVIVTGDNHQSFTERVDGRWLINPGSMMRGRSDQKDHRPCVYLVSRSSGGIVAEPVYLATEADVWVGGEDGAAAPGSEMDGRMEAFVTRALSHHAAGVSFLDNMKVFLSSNKQISAAVRRKIATAIENKKIEV